MSISDERLAEMLDRMGQYSHMEHASLGFPIFELKALFTELQSFRAAAKVRAIREGDGEYVPHVIRYDSAGAGDPYWEFIDADTVAVIAPMRAANVELMYDLVDRSKVIGMRVYDPASPIPTTGGERE